MTRPRILERRLAWESPYMRVVAKEVDLGGLRGVETFWSVSTSGYVAVVAVTQDGRIPLVQQYRPAVETDVLELPSGAIDVPEAPEDAARRELLEETGCAAGELVPLGRLHVDTGRLETQQWAYFAPEVEVVTDRPTAEEDLELVFATPAELKQAILTGRFRLSTHVGIVGLAAMSGRLEL